jgi:S1-C subfamily serine protease
MFLIALTSDHGEQVVSITAVFLVDSIDDLTSTGRISKGFIGLILLPIVGNAAGKLPRTLGHQHSVCS